MLLQCCCYCSVVAAATMLLLLLLLLLILWSGKPRPLFYLRKILVAGAEKSLYERAQLTTTRGEKQRPGNRGGESFPAFDGSRRRALLFVPLSLALFIPPAVGIVVALLSCFDILLLSGPYRFRSV